MYLVYWIRLDIAFVVEESRYHNSTLWASQIYISIQTFYNFLKISILAIILRKSPIAIAIKKISINILE